MQLPRKIKVLGRPWKVTRHKTLELHGHACYGICDLENREIQIVTYISDEQVREVFFHEFIHAIWGESGIDFEGIPLWVEHVLIAGLTKDMLMNDSFWAEFFTPWST